MDGKLSDFFFIQLEVYQGSVLNPLLFAIVMDPLTQSVMDGSLFELLYANDLAFCAKSVKDVMGDV